MDLIIWGMFIAYILHCRVVSCLSSSLSPGRTDLGSELKLSLRLKSRIWDNCEFDKLYQNLLYLQCLLLMMLKIRFSSSLIFSSKISVCLNCITGLLSWGHYWLEKMRFFLGLFKNKFCNLQLCR